MSREFRSLLDAVPPADKDEVHKLFKEDLGDEPAKLFKTFEETPFASASIAQVHYATLHSGEEVVVKIQRPGIRRRVAADLQILKRGRSAGRAGQARPTAFRPGRRRRLRRQPGRRARLPARGTVDGRLGLAHARLAAGPQHPGAAGATGT